MPAFRGLVPTYTRCIELQPDLHLSITQAERILEAWLDAPVACTDMRPLQGGMVNTVLLLEFDRPPHRAVVKLHGAEGDPFTTEAGALAYLRAETACPVPAVYLHDRSASRVPYAFLLLEHVPGVCLHGLEIEPAERADLERQLAGVLDELHGHTASSFGTVDAVRAGRGSTSWADIVATRLAEVRGHPALPDRLAPDVLERVDAAIGLAPDLLHEAGVPTLVHGDVWDGNMLVAREDGRWRLTGLLDPDLQFADAEYELAYLEVFDASREVFFAAYGRGVRPGYERRRLVYWLHTALVHVALFGDEFFGDFTARTADRITRRDA